MPTFTQPQPLKSSLKIAIFGPAGSGKTFTSLLIAEGLARHSGKRVAFADTEQGTAFYSQPVPQRSCHPEAFEFDVSGGQRGKARGRRAAPRGSATWPFVHPDIPGRTTI